MSGVFGPILTGTDVEQAVTEFLQTWSPTYLAEMERITGRDPHKLPQIRSWNTVPAEPEKWPEDQLPAVLVISPGLIGEPQEEGDGSVNCVWSISLSVICSARTQEATSSLAKLYIAHLRAILMHNRSIGEFARDTDWLGEAYDTVPQELRRTLAGATSAFAVEVEEVLNVNGGLEEPPADPYEDVPDWPTVEETDVTADKL